MKTFLISSAKDVQGLCLKGGGDYDNQYVSVFWDISVILVFLRENSSVPGCVALELPSSLAERVFTRSTRVRIKHVNLGCAYSYTRVTSML